MSRRIARPTYCRYCTNQIYLPNGGRQHYCSVKCHFFGNVIPNNNLDACWIWNGLLDEKGYGRSSFKNKMLSAHGLSHRLFNGPVAEGLVVRHSCDNPPCVNPNHLSVGTVKDNSADMVERCRQTKGERCHTHVLTEKEVLEIIELKGTHVSIAQKYDVNVDVIAAIRLGKSWTWLTKIPKWVKPDKVIIDPFKYKRG